MQRFATIFLFASFPLRGFFGISGKSEPKHILHWTGFCLLQMQPLRAVLVNRCSSNIWKSFSNLLKSYQWRNSFLIKLWPRVCNFTEKNSVTYFSKTLLKFSKLLFCRESLWRWRLLLLIDKNSRYYKRCIKQTPRQFYILINDSDLREID